MELMIRLPEGPERMGVTGPAERNLKILREALGVTLTSRHGALRVSGESQAVGQAAHVLEQLADAATRHQTVNRQRLLEMITEVSRVDRPHPVTATRSVDGSNGNYRPDELDVYLPGKIVRPMTDGQRHYLDAMQSHDLTFCCGPAGTGKTYLAVATAVARLKAGHVRKLVLARPAVEAGEKLGFLPGTMQEKVNPYLRPLLDGLHDMMDFEQIQRLMAVDVIEIVPLAFMRGRTLNDALIILDEAQNTTRSQMMMFLTRLGHGSKMVVTGDTSQIDLEKPQDSGLVDAVRRLRRTSGVATVTLTGQDIVRHSLVQRIVEAYGQPDPGRQITQQQEVMEDSAAAGGNVKN